MLEEHENDGGKLFDMYKQRVRRLACGFPLDDNYFAWQAFGRRYDHEGRRGLPDYLKRENYDPIKSMVGRVETHIASLGDYLQTETPGGLNGFIFLDSQDWMPPQVIEDLWRQVVRKSGGPDTRVIFRTAGEKSPVETALCRPSARPVPLRPGAVAGAAHAGSLGDLRHVPPLRDAPRLMSTARGAAVSSSNNRGGGPADQAVAMDRMYRVTRHIYDLTRAYYLLGRDRLLDKVATSPAAATLEVGCGTARNLIRLARRPEPGELFGLDASHEMLETAAASIARSGVDRRPEADRAPAGARRAARRPADVRPRRAVRHDLFLVLPVDGADLARGDRGGAREPEARRRDADRRLLGPEGPPGRVRGRPQALALAVPRALPPGGARGVTELGASGRADVTFESVASRYAYIATVRKN